MMDAGKIPFSKIKFNSIAQRIRKIYGRKKGQKILKK